ncbi:diadenylate cyclase CdaA [Amedibacillus sp. YH-ame10]
MFSYFTLNNLKTLILLLMDIAFVWAVIYYCLRIVKNNSRTIQIFKGVLLIIIIRFAASVLELNTVKNLADSIMNWGVIAIIIIFQPEIRNILEKIGKTSVFSRISTLTVNEREQLVDELVKSCAEMSKTKTGALISIEQGHSLSDFIKTGTPMNSVVSSELLCSIFQYGTPLHDGAVIIQGVKIACAAAYFPPTTRELPTSYGARHRAAVGISEITDSITIVVSEETGNISIAEAGKLSVISESSLHEFLMDIVCNQNVVAKEKAEEPRDKEILKETLYEQGKKPSVFAHYFKGKNRRVKDSDENEQKYAKKKKNEEVEPVKTEKKEMEIEDLAQKQDSGFDQFFDNIVSESEKKEESRKNDKQKAKQVEIEIEETPVPKKRPRKTKSEEVVKEDMKKEVKKEERKPSSISTMGADLFDDVVEPETIVLHYESADDDGVKKTKEGSDS